MKQGRFIGIFMVLMAWSIGALGQSNVVETTSTITTSSTIYDNCSGEYVDFSGTVGLIVDTWVDGNGATHIRTKVPTLNVKGTGESTHGTYIVQTNGGSVEMTSAETLPFETTTVSRMALIGTGPLPNEFVLMIFHQTVNPDGTTTSEVDQMVDKCK